MWILQDISKKFPFYAFRKKSFSINLKCILNIEPLYFLIMLQIVYQGTLK